LEPPLLNIFVRIMHTYFAYGLCISSEIPLLEFPIGHGNANVFVRYVPEPTGRPVPHDRDYDVEIDPGRARFWFRDAGEFLVLDGRTILVHPTPGVDEGLIRLYIEGMIMAMLLYQRGASVLHASVVKIGSRAVAFCGHVGAGKSSLAAAMHARGHAVISDDNAAVHIADGRAIVNPAYPYVKLFPAIANVLGFGNDAVRTLHESQKKIAGIVRGGFSSRPLPLERLYCLGRQHPSEIRPLSASQLMVELLCNSVPTRWGCRGDREHLQRCGDVARTIKAFTLRTFEALDSLPELAQRIEAHCESGEKSTTAHLGLIDPAEALAF